MSLFVFVVVFRGWNGINAIDGRYGVSRVHVFTYHVVDIALVEVFKDDIKDATDHSVPGPIFVTLNKLVDLLDTFRL
jgi:hypothetical protein